MKTENVKSLKDFGSFDPEKMSPAAKAAMEQAGAASRRDFVKSAGIMMIGFGAVAKAPDLLAQASPISPAGTVDATLLDSWVAIGADENITAYTGKLEL